MLLDDGEWLTTKDKKPLVKTSLSGQKPNSHSFKSLFSERKCDPGRRKHPLREYGQATITSFLQREFQKKRKLNAAYTKENNYDPDLVFPYCIDHHDIKKEISSSNCISSQKESHLKGTQEKNMNINENNVKKCASPLSPYKGDKYSLFSLEINSSKEMHSPKNKVNAKISLKDSKVKDLKAPSKLHNHSSSSQMENSRKCLNKSPQKRKPQLTSPVKLHPQPSSGSPTLPCPGKSSLIQEMETPELPDNVELFHKCPDAIIPLTFSLKFDLDDIEIPQNEDPDSILGHGNPVACLAESRGLDNQPLFEDAMTQLSSRLPFSQNDTKNSSQNINPEASYHPSINGQSKSSPQPTTEALDPLSLKAYLDIPILSSSVNIPERSCVPASSHDFAVSPSHLNVPSSPYPQQESSTSSLDLVSEEIAPFVPLTCQTQFSLSS